MHIQNLEAEDVYARLRSRPEGLTLQEVEDRRRVYGPNRIEIVEDEPLWRVFLGEFTHFFALVLWSAAGLSLFAAWRQPGEGMATLALAIASVVVINRQHYRPDSITDRRIPIGPKIKANTDTSVCFSPVCFSPGVRPPSIRIEWVEGDVRLWALWRS